MTMRAEDQFHIGIVVEDFGAALSELTELLGYEWCDEMCNPTNVVYADGSKGVVNSSFAYSMSTPRLEIIRTIPDSLWVPAPGSGVHHMGYWSDDIAADSDALIRHGFLSEVVGTRPDGEPFWAYHRQGSGPRIELVTRALQPTLEQYFSTGRVPGSAAPEGGTA